MVDDSLILEVAGIFQDCSDHDNTTMLGEARFVDCPVKNKCFLFDLQDFLKEINFELEG